MDHGPEELKAVIGGELQCGLQARNLHGPKYQSGPTRACYFVVHAGCIGE
jgi:hypothetical protein